MDPRLEETIKEHPCFDRDAHAKFARMHLPVAPLCNIQCGYCNRKYDCSNESRPGVTSEVLSPEEAVEKVRAVKAAIPHLRVVGVAGPGDPLANEGTLRTLELVNREFPELTLCVSTNGLALPGMAQALHDRGVRFLTVTMNASDPEVGKEVYDRVRWDGRTYTGREGAEVLLRNQVEGIKACVGLGMAVKVNAVMIPGVNDRHIPDLVKAVKALGVYMVNILPLIPVEGTRFGGMRAPTPEERRMLMDRCELDVRMMRHCRQCRADAIGLLGEDRSQEFARMGSCQAGCGPSAGRAEPLPVTVATGVPALVAVATSDGENVDSGFGNAPRFDVYSVSDGEAKLIRTVRINTSGQVAGDSHRQHIMDILNLLSGCSVVVVKEIGPMPSRLLAERGVAVRIRPGAIAKDTFGHSRQPM